LQVRALDFSLTSNYDPKALAESPLSWTSAETATS